MDEQTLTPAMTTEQDNQLQYDKQMSGYAKLIYDKSAEELSQRTLFSEGTATIANAALKQEGITMPAQELMDLAREASEGDAGYVAMKVGDRNAFALSVAGKMIPADQLSGSIERMAKMVEGISGKGVAQATVDKVSRPFTKAAGGNPAQMDKVSTLGAALNAMKIHGMVTDEDIKLYQDKENVEVAPVIDPKEFQRTIMGGINMYAQGTKPQHAVSAVLSDVADRLKNTRGVGIQQKMSILGAVYDTMEKGIQTKEDELHVKGQVDQINLGQQVGSALKSEAQNPQGYAKLSDTEMEDLQISNKKLGAEYSVVQSNLKALTIQKNAMGTALMGQLDSLGINTKAMAEELRTGKDSSAIMMVHISHLKGEEKAKAMQALAQWKQFDGQINGLKYTAQSTGDTIKKNVGLMSTGYAVDMEKFASNFKGLSVSAVNDVMTSSKYKDLLTASAPEGLDKQLQMLLVDKVFTKMAEKQPEGKQEWLTDKRMEYQKAIREGRLSEMDGGAEIAAGVKQLNQEGIRKSNQEIAQGIQDKFDASFFKKVVEKDSPEAFLEQNKGSLHPRRYAAYEDALKQQQVPLATVLTDDKTSKSLQKAALLELEKESATVASTVAESLKFIRGGTRDTKGELITTTTEAMTAVVTSGIADDHKAALISLLAKANEFSGVSKGRFVDGYGFDRLFEAHTLVSKVTGNLADWPKFMDMYTHLDGLLEGASKDVTKDQKKQIVNDFIKEATDPLMNKIRAASVSNLAIGQ